MDQSSDGFSRRDFVKGSMLGLAGLPLLGQSLGAGRPTPPQTARIALCKTGDRRQGVRNVINMVDFEPPKDRHVLIKPNFNTADPAPGSTHNDTLREVIGEMQRHKAASIRMGDRCGPAKMPDVLAAKGIPAMTRELEFEFIDFGALPDADWMPFNTPGLHWENGFSVARPIREAEYIVTTPCLKTHQYGGVFSMSLKLAVGITPRSLMRQLHGSEHMRRMIAEINLAYFPKLIVLDGIECFTDGGPMNGRRARADVVLAGTDRVAMDAVGLAVLRELGANDAIMGTPIFQQEQIARAVELGLGVGHPQQIEFITDDRESRSYADKLKTILARG